MPIAYSIESLIDQISKELRKNPNIKQNIASYIQHFEKEKLDNTKEVLSSLLDALKNTD